MNAGSKEQLDLAQRHGMYGWTGASGSGSAGIRKRVAELKTHPALLYWETEDEPSYQWNKPGPRVTPEKIQAAYKLTKDLDPARPVYLNHATNLVDTLKAYNPGGNLIATDIYAIVPEGIRPQYALWSDGKQGDS